MEGKKTMNGMRKQLKMNEKVALFGRRFSGLRNLYGTYDLETKRCYVLKRPVDDKVLIHHLKGTRPYGVFLLMDDRIRAIAVDFDRLDPDPVGQFVHRAQHYQIPAYVEVSKSKGFHVWIFFEERGVLAAKARMVIHHILQEIDCLDVEIFPKQDRLNSANQYGNYINAPLFGQLVSKGKTVFVDPNDSFHPYPDQWEFLATIDPVPESVLDETIEINDLKPLQDTLKLGGIDEPKSFALPPCAREILDQGVCENQRVACFRLAVHLKRIGLPFDIAMVVLKVWSLKNRPANGKQRITDHEIKSQAQWAYEKEYRGYGCGEPVIKSFCSKDCPLFQRTKSNKTGKEKAS